VSHRHQPRLAKWRTAKEIVTELIRAADNYAARENQFDDMTVVAARIFED
jgi:serine phosphatase RsbU (regulator of sigma subunit)